MTINEATEQAYKNGYEKGIKDLAERLKEVRRRTGGDNLVEPYSRRREEQEQTFCVSTGPGSWW